MTNPLWQPDKDRQRSSRLFEFMQYAGDIWDKEFYDYETLYQWSIQETEKFWLSVWEFTGIIAESRGDLVITNSKEMPGAKWFPDARLNYAENLLRRNDEDDAIIFWGENIVRKRLTFSELKQQVAGVAKSLKARGIRPGDRVAGYLPNMPETIISMLATASLGAIWVSCSPDFGVQGILDRFGQIRPKLLIAVDGYYYGGKTIDCLKKLHTLIPRLPSVTNTIVVSYTQERPKIEHLANSEYFDDILTESDSEEIEFVPMPFNHPLFIMFSSGTTGIPKCIVHGAGGTLIQHLKEHQLHTDIKENDKVFYFTTCGWMMWNWLASALASKATLLLYDGAPFYPDGNILFDFAEKENMTLFGTSAKFIDAANKGGLAPIKTHSLNKLKTITSTGSPLAPESFNYVYSRIKNDIHLASISGGTDIISCFALGNPIEPVWAGELQAKGLGMEVDIFDDLGKSVQNIKGELVCKNSFPSMPICFWNDKDYQKYRKAYFKRFPGIWHHGDYVASTDHNGMIIYGRSDAVLNPGGVRIGTAEIYRQVEQFQEVEEALCVGQEWEGDIRVILFLRLTSDVTLDNKLAQHLRQHIRDKCTPRHVPAKIIQVRDIPRTRSGKITELAVKAIIHGEEVKNREALANPESLDYYEDLEELKN